MAKVEAICVGRMQPTTFGILGRTAIDKRPVTGRVRIDASGVDGDEIANREHHGAPDRAVSAFAREDYAFWETELGRTFPAGSFGENLTTVGLDIQNARIGERWRVGECVLEVTCTRTPCAPFAGFIGAPDWMERFTVHGVPGAMLRVIEPGTVAAGDEIEVIETRDHDITVGYAFRAVTTRPELLPGVAVEPRAGGSLRTKLEGYVARAGAPAPAAPDDPARTT